MNVSALLTEEEADFVHFVCLVLSFRITEGCLPLHLLLLFCWLVPPPSVLLRVSITFVTFVIYRETFN